MKKSRDSPTEKGKMAENPLYSALPAEYGQAREARVKEWKTGYLPGIIPQHIRYRRRTHSLNPHFLTFTKPKHTAKRHLYVRLGVIEFSLQNGLGARYRLVPAPKKSFDFPIKCVSRVLFGSTCCAVKLREEACIQIVREWDFYKWEVKYSYAFYIEFFRRYDPSDPRESVQDRAKFLYKIAVFERMYECTRLEISVACEQHETNFYCIEAIDHESFRVVPSETNFNRSVYVFAKEIPYAGRMLDKTVGFYEHYYLIWLNPIIEFGHNLTMPECILRITYSNTDIGYFHLCEEDPNDPRDDFNISNAVKYVRHRFVRFFPMVYALHYYQHRPKGPWRWLMQSLGIWQEPEVDERIARYNKLMVNRFHQLEKDFERIAEVAYPAFPIDSRQLRRNGEAVEEFLNHIKNPTEKEFKLKYRANKIRKKFLRKYWRNRRRIVAISQRFNRIAPNPEKKHLAGPKRVPHHHRHHHKHRITRHAITRETPTPQGGQTTTKKK